MYFYVCFSDVEEREDADEDVEDAGEGTSAQPDKSSKKTTVSRDELYNKLKVSVSSRSYTQLDEGEHKTLTAMEGQLVNNHAVFVSYGQKLVYAACLLGKTLDEIKKCYSKKKYGKPFTTYIQDLVPKSKGSVFVKKGSKRDYNGFSTPMINFYIALHKFCLEYNKVMYTSIAIRDLRTNFKYLKSRITEDGEFWKNLPTTDNRD
jgi:hypothetical protein